MNTKVTDYVKNHAGFNFIKSEGKYSAFITLGSDIQAWGNTAKCAVQNLIDKVQSSEHLQSFIKKQYGR